MRIINQRGLDLVKHFEGCKLTVYKDLKGLPTVGYGHRVDGKMEVGAHISQDTADQFLLEDLAIAEAEVQSLVHVPLTDNQFSALVSLVYNCGRTPLTHHLGYFLNMSMYDKAADQFLQWDMCGGEIVQGLADRRAAERALFLSND